MTHDEIAHQLIVRAKKPAIAILGRVKSRLDKYSPKLIAGFDSGLADKDGKEYHVVLYQLMNEDLGFPDEELLGTIAKDTGAEELERNALLGKCAAAVNDPLYDEQWALERISTPQAWDVIANSPRRQRVTVGVLDSGVDATHPDLRARIDPRSKRLIWQIQDGYFQDEDGHGTFLCGTVGAITNNRIGVASPAYRIPLRLLAVKWYDPWTPLDAFNAARAIIYALRSGARVINASWHIGLDRPILRWAVKITEQYDVVFAAAAGNDGTSNDELETWPASYPFSNVIAVMASDRYDDRPGWSNYGSQTVHLAAPGVGILSTHYYLQTVAWRNYTGTSPAAALVASAAAIIRSLRPQMSALEIRNHLIASVDPVPYLDCVARGRLNLGRALETLP